MGPTSEHKMALCISGTFRTYQKCYESLFRNVIDAFPGQVDIFMQSYFSSEPYNTWWRDGQDDAKWDEMQRAIEVYKPKAISMGDMEPMAQYWKKKFHDEKRFALGYNNHHGEFGMQLFGIKSAYELAKNYGDYDVFCRCRYDSWFFEPVEFEQNWEFKDDFIMLCRGCIGARSGLGCPFTQDEVNKMTLTPMHKLNDQFFWAAREPYEYLATLIDYAEDYCDPDGENILFENEHLYYRHMLKKDSKYRLSIDESVYQILVRPETPDSYLIYER